MFVVLFFLSFLMRLNVKAQDSCLLFSYGDFNCDRNLSVGDFLEWRNKFLTNTAGYDIGKFLLWRSYFVGLNKFPEYQGILPNDVVLESIPNPKIDQLMSDRVELLKQKAKNTRLNLGDKPNVFILVADDMPMSTFGKIAGTISGKEVTPVLNRIANEGAWLSKFYVTEASCAPSRATMWTSKLPHTHGVTANEIVIGKQPTLPLLFKAAGYRTSFVGKCHLLDRFTSPSVELMNNFGFDNVVSFDKDIGGLYAPFNEDVWFEYALDNNGEIEQVTKADNKFVVGELTNRALLKVSESIALNQPFFVWLSHIAPHFPAPPNPSVPKKFTYDGVKNSMSNISLSKEIVFTSGIPYVDLSWARRRFLKRVGSGLAPATEDWYDQIEKSYLGKNRDMVEYRQDVLENVDRLDVNVANIEHALKALGQWDKTIFIFISDNGVSLGEHGLEEKGSNMYDELVRVPVVIRYPEKIKNTGEVSQLLSSLDFAPTVTALAGIEPDSSFQGKSFDKSLFDKNIVSRESVSIEYAGQYPKSQDKRYVPIRGTVTSGDLKLVHYSAHDGKYLNNLQADESTFIGNTDKHYYQMFDLLADKAESNNLLEGYGGLGGSVMEKIKTLYQNVGYRKRILDLLKEKAKWVRHSEDGSWQIPLPEVEIKKMVVGTSVEINSVIRSSLPVYIMTEIENVECGSSCEPAVVTVDFDKKSELVKKVNLSLGKKYRLSTYVFDANLFSNYRSLYFSL